MHQISKQPLTHTIMTKQHRQPPLLAALTGAACIIFFALSSSTAAAQIYEASNDPDSLCISGGSVKHTGYKATKDCRGYVYCNDGYLMGGGAAGGESPSGISGGTGVIACWPNQLFDESKNACTYWQDVDTSSINCPDFDGSKMMPDQYDTNANEERFFCGNSWSHAKSVCEPCAGGSMTECSDKGHNCFAGVTGCPSNNVSSNSSNNSQPKPAPVTPPTTAQLVSPATSSNSVAFNTNIQNQQQPSPAIAFVNPTPPTTTTTTTSSSSFSSSSNKQCTNHSDCQSVGKFCNLDTMVCESSGQGGAVAPSSQEANILNNGGSSSTSNTLNTAATPLYTNTQGNNYFCGETFSSVVSKCIQSKPCPNGFASGYCAATEGCFRVSQCGLEYEAAASTASASGGVSSISNGSAAAAAVTANQKQPSPPSPAIVTNPTPPTVATSTNNGSGGLSPEVFHNTPPNQQPSPAVIVTSPEPPTNYGSNYKQCTSHAACTTTTGQFCNQGFCGQCSNVLGCSVDEVCRTASCHVTQTEGPGKCYKKKELHSFCQVAWDTSYQCNLDTMVCESTNVAVAPQTTPNNDDPVVVAPTTTKTSPPSSQPTKAPTTPGPTKSPTLNVFFCGTTWQAHVKDCDNALPCPRGDECATNETCFAGSPCAKKQEGNAAEVTETTTTTAAATITTTTSTVATTSKSPAIVVTDSNTSSDQDTIGNIAILNGDTNQSSSDQATTKTDVKDEITIKNCDICDGAGQLDLDATVFYDGTEVSCHELEGKTFFEEGIAMGSDKCRTSQELYSATCCIVPPKNPCNLCRSGDNDFLLKSEVNVVSATGERESCLELFQSLLSREDLSVQCLSSQKELQAKCCDGTYDYNNAPVPSPGIEWSPSASVDEPVLGSPSKGFYYTNPDWNNSDWNNWNCSSRITSTATATALFALLSMAIVA